MSRRRRSAPELKRPGARLEPRSRFILFCEGLKTEIEYFAAIRRVCSSTLIAVETHGGQGDPYTIAKKAIERAKELGLTRQGRRRKNSFEEGDQIWAVFDRDAHCRFNEAVANCASSNVRVGRSNPCFELWLILHEEFYDRYEHRHDMQKKFAELRPEYDPDGAKTPDCDDLVKRAQLAEERSATQLKRREKEDKPFGNPSTTIGQLTYEIRQANSRAVRP